MTTGKDLKLQRVSADVKVKDAEKNYNDVNARKTAQDAAHEKAMDTNVALWGFVGAGVAAAGTVAFYFLTRPSTKKPPVNGAVGVSPQGLTVVVEGQF